VVDKQDIKIDNYDFIQNGPNLKRYLRITGYTVRSATRKIEIGFGASEDILERLINDYSGYQVYWTDKKDDRQGGMVDYLYAAQFDADVVIASHQDSFRLYIPVENWVSAIRMGTVNK